MTVKSAAEESQKYESLAARLGSKKSGMLTVGGWAGGGVGQWVDTCEEGR